MIISGSQQFNGPRGECRGRLGKGRWERAACGSGGWLVFAARMMDESRIRLLDFRAWKRRSPESMLRPGCKTGPVGERGVMNDEDWSSLNPPHLGRSMAVGC